MSVVIYTRASRGRPSHHEKVGPVAVRQGYDHVRALGLRIVATEHVPAHPVQAAEIRWPVLVQEVEVIRKFDQGRPRPSVRAGAEGGSEPLVDGALSPLVLDHQPFSTSKRTRSSSIAKRPLVNRTCALPCSALRRRRPPQPAGSRCLEEPRNELVESLRDAVLGERLPEVATLCLERDGRQFHG